MFILSKNRSQYWMCYWKVHEEISLPMRCRYVKFQFGRSFFSNMCFINVFSDNGYICVTDNRTNPVFCIKHSTAEFRRELSKGRVQKYFTDNFISKYLSLIATYHLFPKLLSLLCQKVRRNMHWMFNGELWKKEKASTTKKL